MKHHREQILWITAQVVRKLTGLTNEEMRSMRKNNPGFYKPTENNSYLYNAKMIEPLVKKIAA